MSHFNQSISLIDREVQWWGNGVWYGYQIQDCLGGQHAAGGRVSVSLRVTTDAKETPLSLFAKFRNMFI